MKTKSDIRKNVLSIRDGLDDSIREEKSIKILNKLKSLDVLKNAKHILFYYSFNSEVSTISLMEELFTEKNIYLPRIISNSKFKAFPVQSLSDLKIGEFGIPEPLMTDKSHESKIDCIIIPGVAFDKKGNRIGMGKGYYDRYLKSFNRIPKIGLGFSEQILDEVPKESYDEPVDLIVTDESIFIF